MKKTRAIQLTSEEDRITNLPDEILGLIMSSLTVKEAAITSILSRRWRYLWTFITHNLDFDGTQIGKERLYGMVWRANELELERSRFVNWVNQVLLQNYRGPTTIDKIRICFTILDRHDPCKNFGYVHNIGADNFRNYSTGPDYEQDIDSWIDFVLLQKRVKFLELDFTCFSGLNSSYILEETPFLGWNDHRIDSLTCLKLCYVEVTGQVLECILLNCAFLETLCVDTSRSLVSFKVPGANLKLMHLEILRCHSLVSMDVSGVNLVSIKYIGPKITVSFNNLPCLVEVSIGGRFARYLVDNAFEFSRYLWCLQTLELDMSGMIIKNFPRFPELCNLKRLDLRLHACRGGAGGLLFCTSLLKAFPMLHWFALKIIDLDDVIHCGKVKVRGAKLPLRFLKVVEIIGFVGYATDFEFARHMLTNVASLEKMIIDPRSPYERERKLNFDNAVAKSVARSRAKRLETVLPPGVKLVIL